MSCRNFTTSSGLTLSRAFNDASRDSLCDDQLSKPNKSTANESNEMSYVIGLRKM